jgi:hypothetical protein
VIDKRASKKIKKDPAVNQCGEKRNTGRKKDHIVNERNHKFVKKNNKKITSIKTSSKKREVKQMTEVEATFDKTTNKLGT